MRKQLSPLAVGEVRSWLDSPVAAVRRLAVAWLGEIGSARDDALLRGALLDADAGVVRAALDSLTRVEAARDWVTVLGEAAPAWDPARLMTAIAWWSRRDQESFPGGFEADGLPGWRSSNDSREEGVVAQVAVARCLLEAAARRAEVEAPEGGRRNLVQAADLLLRRLEALGGAPLTPAAWPGAALPLWASGAPQGMGRVWIRAMARRRMPEAMPLLRAMFDGEAPADRRVALVELSALGPEDLIERLNERWHLVLERPRSSNDRITAEEPGAWEIYEVMMRGPAEFAWLLPRSLDGIDFDWDLNDVSGSGEEVLYALTPSIRRWGERGFDALVEAARGGGRVGACAESLLFHLRGEIPAVVRARIDVVEGDPRAHDRLSGLRTRLGTSTSAEEDERASLLCSERIGLI